MRAFVLTMVVLAPLSARADASVEDGGARRIERCLLAVRRALAVDYPRDDDGDDEHYCQRRGAELSCRGVCDDRSCHNDACESWLTSIDVALAPATGAATAWTRRPDVVSGWIYRRRVGGVDVQIAVDSRRESEFSRELAGEVQKEAALARRALDACLSP